MPTDCEFELNKPDATYFSGETIFGTITLRTTSDKNVRDVSIIFLGEGKVCWTESHTVTDSNNSTSTYTTYFKSHETYVNNRTQVHDNGVLKAGTYNFTFNITLPWECPTSYEGKYGHVRYEISLKVNRYYRYDNVYKKPVTIIKTIDLNLDPAYKIPIKCEEFTSPCCWPCSKGDIFSTLTIPFGAYAPGQIVKYELHIANTSMNDTDGYIMELIQKIIFTAKNPYRKERECKNILLSRDFPDICLRLTNHILRGEFVIPAVPPTTARSSIICVEYTLKVTVQMSCCVSNAILKIPIIIGTIPIRESLSSNNGCNWNEQQQISPSAPELPQPKDNTLPPNYNDIQPPTFEEAIRSSSPFIDTDTNERHRIVGFRPLYPMYSFSSPAK